MLEQIDLTEKWTKRSTARKMDEMTPHLARLQRECH